MNTSEFTERDQLDASRDSRRQVHCGDCRFLTYDMDGNYCGSPESFKAANPFGQGLTRARSAEGVCGPKGKLWEKR